MRAADLDRDLVQLLRPEDRKRFEIHAHAHVDSVMIAGTILPARGQLAFLETRIAVGTSCLEVVTRENR